MKTRTYPLLLILLFLAMAAHASWWDVLQQDTALDLIAARKAALQTLIEAPGSPDAVAVAAWWEDNLDNLSRPAEILDAARPPLQPALAFLLNRIESELSERPPAGCPPFAEISGPWGLFGRLDLERNPLPSNLPPLQSAWAGPGTHFRYRLQTETGRVQTPSALSFGGFSLSGWNLKSEKEMKGWMVVEISGNANIVVDGEEIARLRDPGINSPNLLFYKARFSAGAHRIQAAMAPQSESWIRLSFLDEDGNAFEWKEADPAEMTPGVSTLKPVDPLPPRQAQTIQDALCDLQLAMWRRDPPRERKLVDHLLHRWPKNELAHLAAAEFYLLEQTGAGLDEDYNRAHRELELSGKFPLRKMLEYLLAQMQDRQEDADKLRASLMKTSISDPRVLRLKIEEALSRSWPREAEEALDTLERKVGHNDSLVKIRLEVLQSLGRWDERHSLVQSLVGSSAPRTSLVNLLADECCQDEALKIMEKIRKKVSHPNLDADTIRLLMSAGHVEEARARLREAFDTWGQLPLFQDLGLTTLAPGSKEWKELLQQASTARPQDIDLRALADRWGLISPFWEKEHIDAAEFIATAKIPDKGVDTALLLDQAIEQVSSNGSSLYYYHGLTKALTPEGVSQASLLQGMPGSERLQLRIFKADGRIIIPAKINATRGRLQIDEVEVGDVVEDEYLASVSAIAPSRAAHLSPYVYRFADPQRSFGLSEYEVIYPRHLSLKIDGMFEGLQRSEEDDGDQHILRFKAEGIPPTPPEPFGPPEQDLLPWVTYGFGLSWQDVGDSIREKLIPVLRGSPELDSFVRTYLDGSDDHEALHRLVQALLEKVKAGRAGLDLTSSIGESFSKGAGNRLAILAGCLLSSGYEVDLVLSRPTPMSGAHLVVPSLDVFSLPLLRVHWGNELIWIDLSEEINGLGHISPSVQASDALVIPLGNPSTDVQLLKKLPVYENPMLEDQSELHAVIAEDGSARVDFNSWVTPPSAQDLKQKLDSVPTEMMGPVFQRLASRYFPGASSVEGHYHTLADGRLKITFSFDFSSACEPEADSMSCRGLLIAEPLAPVLASLPKRETPLILQIPVIRILDFSIEAPAGWRVSQAPPRKLESKWGEIHEDLRRRENLLDSRLRLEIPATTVSPREYPEFSRFCRATDELLLRPAELHRVQ